MPTPTIDGGDPDGSADRSEGASPLNVPIGRDVTAPAAPGTIEALRQQAEAGDRAAQYRLARLHAIGDGVPRDAAVALHWMREAAERGVIEAYLQLGLMYAAELDRDGHFTGAFEWLQRAARAGDTRAPQELEILHGRASETMEGLIHLADQCADPAARHRLRQAAAAGDPRAHRWMTKAAEGGDIDACFELGLIQAGTLDREKDFAAAFHWLERAAERGHARAAQELEILRARALATSEGLVYLAEQTGDAAAQYRLAQAYAAGEIVAHDPARAHYWLTAAGEGGHIDACFELGLTHAGALEREGGLAGAFHWLQRAAERGHARAAQELEILRARALATSEGLVYLAEQAGDAAAQYCLAHAYAAGEIVPHDSARAHYWLTAAGEGGHVDACFEVGLAHAGAFEREGGLAAAFHWLQRAAERGHARAAQELEILRARALATPEGLIYLAEQAGDAAAQYRLAHAYAAGEIVPHDSARARHWLTAAGQGGHIDACFELGLAHAGALEREGGLAGALHWLQRAAQRGHARAAQELEILRTQALATLEGLIYLAERDDTVAQLRLAERYATAGVGADPAAAVHWLQRSAELGDAEAQYRLGVAFAAGFGVTRDEATGRRWLARAAAAGHAQAQVELDDQGTTPTIHIDAAVDRTFAGMDGAVHDRPVVVMGEGAFAWRFASILRRLGLAAENSGERTPDAATRATLFLTDGLDFTPAGQVSCDFARYAAAMEDTSTRFPHARIRHPVLAHDMIRLPYAQSAALFGLPGSGNIVFSAVVSELQRYARCQLSPDQQFFQELARLHMEFVIFTLRKTVPELAGWELVPSNQRLGVFDIACVSKSGTADPVGRLRQGLVGRLFHLARVNHTELRFVCHGFDEAGLQRLDDHGFTSILVVRNPLDTIHSLLGKYDSPLGPIVNDYEAFDLLVQGMVTYLTRVRNCAGRHSIVRFETLVTEFENQAAMLADMLDLACDPRLFVKLKKDLLFRNLVGDPTHFRGGQSDRWKKIFDRRHHDILRHRGMFDVMSALDYAPPEAGEFRREPLTTASTTSLRWDLYFFHHLIDVPLPDGSGPDYGRLTEGDVAFHIEDEPIRERLKMKLQTPFGRTLFNLVS